MSIIYTETKSDKDSRMDINIGDGRLMTINITGEGIIMDVYEQADDVESDLTGFDKPMHLGTIGMTFEEWADWIIQFDKDRDVVWPDKAV